MEQRVINFSAGPAALPLKAMEKARDEFLCLPGAGASVMEISHRCKAFDAVHAKAKDNIRTLLNLPENYQVLFTPGGATMNFSMVPMNLMDGKPADYINCGSWASKAIGEAKKFGEVRTVWNGKSDNYNRMPKTEELELNPNAAYLHFTSNETIQGIEFFEEPDAGNVPLVCDASSDFLSRPIDVAPYGLIYAGAQKNVGPSGMAVVIIRDDMIERSPENLPALLDYKLMAENDSLYNTPPTFGIYMVSLVTEWLLEDIGGLEKMETINRQKARMLYDTIDQSEGYYRGHSLPESRSIMNVAFRLPSEELEKKFITEATAAGLDGLKGHRSVGGCRASIYNAMPVEGVESLCNFMREFQQNNG